MTEKKNEIMAVYQTDHGEVKLTPDIIRKYLVSGDASKVTHQEVMMFLTLCQYQKLNPFLREAYLIKYSDKEAATLVVGKEVFTRRAAGSKICDGWEAGVIIQNAKNELEYRPGTFYLKDKEELVGGWSKVFRKDWQQPAYVTVPLEEYMRKKADGKPMASWAKQPATMIRKVALVQALREAFPEKFEGLYSQEEMQIDDTLLNNEPIEISTLNTEPPKEKQEKKDDESRGLSEEEMKAIDDAIEVDEEDQAALFTE